jgi:PiT family inorganic phosphate transporter
MSASFNFIGALTGQAVAKTITGGLLDASAVRALGFTAQVLVISALIGAIAWNLFTWYFGIPSSSSHALIGGVVGAGAAALSVDKVIWAGLGQKVVIPLIFSPIIGFAVSLLLMRLLFWLFARATPQRVGNTFRFLQVFSSAFMALSHGSNDAQKTMGIITLALFSAGFKLSVDAKGTPNIPIEVILLAAVAMALGTAAGGWRIIHTMGQRLAHLEPIHGFAAETAAATVIEAASRLGVPVSTTHTISSAILGVGSTRRLSAVRWGVAGQIVTAWVLTIPACFLLAWTFRSLLGLMGA